MNFFGKIPNWWYICFMTNKINTTNYWNRIDVLLGDTPSKDFCKQNGLNYYTFIGNRIDSRLCNIRETYIIANALGVTVEYLLTGKQPNCYSEELRTVIDILSKDTSKLEAVCTLLGIEKKKQQENDIC